VAPRRVAVAVVSSTSPTPKAAPLSSSAAPTEPADLGSRLIALVIDAVAVVLLLTPLALLANATGAGLPGPLEVVLLWFVYRSVADGLGGSPGKRLLGLRIVGPAGRRPGLGAGAARNLWSLSALLPVILPAALGNALAVGVSAVIGITIARDAGDLGWHDRLAGTAVRRPA
jgi:uncharacterized RDD family membrane protein YckC